MNSRVRLDGSAVLKLVFGPFVLMNSHCFNSTPFMDKWDFATPGFTVESPSFTMMNVNVRLAYLRFFGKTGWLTVHRRPQFFDSSGFRFRLGRRRYRGAARSRARRQLRMAIEAYTY